MSHNAIIHRMRRQLIASKQKAREGLYCHYCGDLLKPSQVTLDHKLPIARGGLNKWSNLVIACRPCNADKANMTDAEYRQYKYAQRRAS